ncbi:endothelin-1 [Paralichthys olivaceus]|uniref:endothelin-1 n=1 Tax=Paralichthys olivaceus TaxID=8255 RepID=UPI00097DC7A0|nr:PREDICTED: endothelin-1-like [Paralichthys olivaceus]
MIIFPTLQDYFLSSSATVVKMDTYILISVLSVMFSSSLCTVLSAPVGETPSDSSSDSRVRHVRNKRCSCATFMDKECVYFCHLDIIWVNTPERVVSYGLGNAPRTRRALPDSMATKSAPRCRCVRENDSTCSSFCRPDNQHLRSQKSQDTLILSEHQLEADKSTIKRWKKSNKKQVSPAALRVALKTRLLLEEWRVRRRHRARAWEGESTAS